MSVVHLKSNASAFSIDLTRAAKITPTVSPSADRSTVNVELNCGRETTVPQAEHMDAALALKMPLDDAVNLADTITTAIGVTEVTDARQRITEGCPICHQHHGHNAFPTLDYDTLPVVTYLHNRGQAFYPQATKPADPGEIATLWSVKFRTADSIEHGPYHFTGQRYSAYTDPIVKRLFYAGDMTTLSSYAFGRQIHEWLARGGLSINDCERYEEVGALLRPLGSVVRVPVAFLHTDGRNYNGFGDRCLQVMFEQLEYQRSIDMPASALEPEGPTLREVIADYLHDKGYEGTLDKPASWRHSSMGVRDFETCVIQQMANEGAYGKTVCGWRDVQVPVALNQSP